MKTLLLVAVSLVVLTAQAPPVERHLVYAFDSRPIQGDGLEGTTDIILGGIAPDGGRVIRATDTLKYHPRPEQTIQCEVYRGGTVKCTQPPYGLSEAQSEMLPMFADGFFAHDDGRRNFEELDDPTRSRHLIFVSRLSSSAVAMTMTLDSSVRWSPDFVESEVMESADGMMRSPVAPHWHDVDTITVDATGIPVRIHSEYANERAQHAGGGGGHLDIHLVKDTP